MGSGAGLKAGRILVVDDDNDIIHILNTVLKRNGYEVITARSGGECLQKIKERKADLVVLDIMMPDIDGWEVCRKIKEDSATCSIPVAMLSVRRAEEDIRKSFEYAHADRHITKPIDSEEIISTVEALLL